MKHIKLIKKDTLWGLLFLLFSLGFFTSFSQTGRLLLVGGGAEKNGVASWSTAAYRWAGEGRRVAIIGTSTGSLAPYFMLQCGAAWAKEFAIASHDSADSQVTYDTLITYEVIFFRGGDQYEYYDLYRDTKLQHAVEYIYSMGGTICGTSAGMSILSSIVFTAENGTAYPDECIENPNNQYITLAGDFMDFVPGFVFDTHFAERARFGRLVAFLANYSLNLGQDITGLGLDDMTCMTVDGNGLGTVYGTGCANIYIAGSHYSLSGSKLLADTVNIIQLLHGCTYDFATGQPGFSTLDLQINTSQLEETGNYTVLASGSNLLANNLGMLDDLVNHSGSPAADILILTGDPDLAESFKTKLTESGAGQVHIFTADLQSGSDTELGNIIDQSSKILFLKNSYPDFSDFLGTLNGGLLKQRIIRDGMITAFAGEDARLAGKTVVGNYLSLYASYYGELTFDQGLSLLRHTVIMPDTYLNSDVYENTATAVPYAMARDTLKYGIWLTNHNYMKFTPMDGKTTLTGNGTAPVMVITNAGSLAGLSSHTGNGSNIDPPRMVAGFDHLRLALIDGTNPYIMGTAQPAGILNNTDPGAFQIMPNPVENELIISGSNDEYNWEITDLRGVVLMKGKAGKGQEIINVSGFKTGFYIFIWKNKNHNFITGKKFIKI